MTRIYGMTMLLFGNHLMYALYAHGFRILALHCKATYVIPRFLRPLGDTNMECDILRKLSHTP